MHTREREERERQSHIVTHFLADIQNIENNWRLGKWFEFSADLGAVGKADRRIELIPRPIIDLILN